MRGWIIGGAALLLAGCATQYGEMGFAGGVRADQMTATTYRIVSRGNGYTDGTTIADFAMRKAAETTLESGNEWFVILGERDRSSTELMTSTTPQTTYGQVTSYGNTATFNTTSYGGGTSVSEVFKPGQDVMIEVGRGQRPARAFDATETLTYVVPRTGGPSSNP